MSKTRDFHAVNAHFRQHGLMKQKRERDRFDPRKVLAQAERDRVYDEEILSEEDQKELRMIEEELTYEL